MSKLSLVSSLSQCTIVTLSTYICITNEATGSTKSVQVLAVQRQTFFCLDTDRKRPTLPTAKRHYTYISSPSVLCPVLLDEEWRESLHTYTDMICSNCALVTPYARGWIQSRLQEGFAAPPLAGHVEYVCICTCSAGCSSTSRICRCIVHILHVLGGRC